MTTLRKMDIKRVDLLIKYILAEGQEDCGNREVGQNDPGYEIILDREVENEDRSYSTFKFQSIPRN